MFINATTLIFKPTDVKEVVRILMDEPLTMAMANPGFLFSFFLESLTEPGATTSFTVWRDAAAAKAFFSKPEYLELVRDLGLMAQAPPQRQMYDSVYLDVKKIPDSVENVWFNISTLPFKAEDVPRVKDFLLSDALRFARQAPGYLFNFVMSPRETPGVLISVSMATDAEKGRAIFNSEEYRAALKDVAEWLVARPDRSEYSCHSLEVKDIPESLLVP